MRMRLYWLMYRYPAAITLFSLMLGIGQFLWQRQTNPTLLMQGIVAMLSLTVLAAIALILLLCPLFYRELSRELRYKWSTRAIDRKMRRRRYWSKW